MYVDVRNKIYLSTKSFSSHNNGMSVSKSNNSFQLELTGQWASLNTMVHEAANKLRPRITLAIIGSALRLNGNVSTTS